MEEYSALKWRKVLTPAATWMSREERVPKEIVTKGQTLYASTEMRSLELLNSPRQRIECWVPGAGEEGVGS